MLYSKYDNMLPDSALCDDWPCMVRYGCTETACTTPSGTLGPTRRMHKPNMFSVHRISGVLCNFLVTAHRALAMALCRTPGVAERARVQHSCTSSFCVRLQSPIVCQRRVRVCAEGDPDAAKKVQLHAPHTKPLEATTASLLLPCTLLNDQAHPRSEN